MDEKLEVAKQLHDAEGNEKIKKLRKKIDKTAYNIEVSKGIIAGTAYDKQREDLIEKNAQREHAISSMKKEIRDIEQVMEE